MKLAAYAIAKDNTATASRLEDAGITIEAVIELIHKEMTKDKTQPKLLDNPRYRELLSLLGCQVSVWLSFLLGKSETGM